MIITVNSEHEYWNETCAKLSYSQLFLCTWVLQYNPSKGAVYYHKNNILVMHLGTDTVGSSNYEHNNENLLEISSYQGMNGS
jgi:hypothetical protein